MIKKTTKLKRMLQSESLDFLLEAHDGLSARIVEEAGFQGIWGSGLSISATLGVRDSNELSWTQVLEAAEFMCDATSIPILLDADTGYGNFNNVRRLVRKLEQRDVAGMCIEDKLFPKSNSFSSRQRQNLANIDEFVGKIHAAKDTQHDDDFCVVARTEALIAGHGMDEALRRAMAYAEAGADAVLVHSKIIRPDDVIEFMTSWTRECPVVIVPTMYHQTPTSLFEELGVSLVIWANHIMRSSVTAMQHAAAMIHGDRSLHQIEPTIASISEVFRLQQMDELKEAERQYLPEIVVTDDRTLDLIREEL